MDKREFNAGYKSGIKTIKDEKYGYEFAIEYLKQKQACINRYTENKIKSYWQGYEKAINDSKNLYK